MEFIKAIWTSYKKQIVYLSVVILSLSVGYVRGCHDGEHNAEQVRCVD